MDTLAQSETMQTLRHEALNSEYAKRWRFSVEDYYRMAHTGILPQHGTPRTELLDGEIFTMSPLGGPHIWAVSRISHALSRTFAAQIDAEEIMLVSQAAVRLLNDSEPEPDIVLVRYSPEQDESLVPLASDVLLLIEVADSSLQFDRTKKAQMYAKAGIPDYWIVNLNDKVLEVHRKPLGSRYNEITTLRNTDTLAPLAFPEISIALSSFLR